MTQDALREERSAGQDATSPAPPPSLGLLSFVHPSGNAASRCIINAPGRTASAVCDVVTLAPTAAQCRAGLPLSGLDELLDEDGVVDVRPPKLWRRRLAARFRQAGYEVGPALILLSDARGERALVPLERRALRAFLEEVVRAGVDRAALRLATDISPFIVAARELSGSVGFLAWRPADRAPLAWVSDAGYAGAVAGWFAVGGWRGASDSVLVYLLGDGGERRAIVKIAREDATSHEDDIIGALGEAAVQAGAAVPAVLGSAYVGARRAVTLAKLEGKSAASEIRAYPARSGALLERIGGWLERWNLATAQRTRFTREHTVQLLAPLDSVTPLLHDSGSYAQSLRGLARSIEGLELPLVATHGDLTLYNVLLDGDGIAVVDWEAATPAGLPLTDLEYVAVDTAAAQRGYADRVAAFRLCHQAHDPFGARLRAVRDHMVALLRLPPAYAELCHHAGWLAHAANEVRGDASGNGAFVRIARELVRAGVAPHG